MTDKDFLLRDSECSPGVDRGLAASFYIQDHPASKAVIVVWKGYRDEKGKFIRVEQISLELINKDAVLREEDEELEAAVLDEGGEILKPAVIAEAGEELEPAITGAADFIALINASQDVNKTVREYVISRMGV